MYQTVGHPTPEHRLGYVIDRRFNALLAAWVALVVGSLGMFLAVGYLWLHGMRLATASEAQVHSIFSWRGASLLATWSFLVGGSWAVFIALAYLWFLGIRLVLSWI